MEHSCKSGCGGGSDTETANNDSNNSSSGVVSETTNIKSTVLSEALSTEKVIASIVFIVN